MNHSEEFWYKLLKQIIMKTNFNTTKEYAALTFKQQVQYFFINYQVERILPKKSF